MVRVVPLPFKQAAYAETVADDIAWLVTIRGAGLGTPLRLTDHSAERVAMIDDQPRYGIKAGGLIYDHAIVGLAGPDDREKTPLATSLVINNIGAEDYAGQIRRLGPTARVDIALVLASRPTEPFRKVLGLRIVGRSYDEETVTIDLSRDAAGMDGGDELEPLIAHRQTWELSPGLHR
jgi:hypothetical protein